MADLLTTDDQAGIARELRQTRAWLRREGIAETDVRLQVSERGTWYLRTGDASYDQDHRGYWGASSLRADDSDQTIANTAADLVSQAEDHAADNGGANE